MPGRAARKRAARRVRALVREAESVHERTVRREAEQVRPRVRLLGARRHRPELEVPEAEGGQGARAARVLVEASGEADDGRKLQAHAAHRDALPYRRRRRDREAHRGPQPSEVLHGPERGEREIVRPVGGQEEEQRPQRSTVEGRVHHCRVR